MNKLESELSNHFCCRNPLLYLSGALGVEHAGVVGSDTSGKRRPYYLPVVQTVGTKTHRK